MALPIQFQGANLVLAPPAGFELEVPMLPVRRLGDGHQVSCWVLTPDERAEVARTGKVWLSVLAGFRHPAIEVAASQESLVRPA